MLIPNNNNQQTWLKRLENQKNLCFLANEKNFPVELYNFAKTVVQSEQGIETINQSKSEYLKTKKEIERSNSDLVISNHELRRIAPSLLLDSFKRILNIQILYDPSKYQKRMKHLEQLWNEAKDCNNGKYHSDKFCFEADCKQRYNLEAVSLKVRYEALKKCIDSESEQKLSYDQSFDMNADLLAVQKIYYSLEEKLLLDFDLHGNEPAKIKLLGEDKKHLKILVGKQQISFKKSSKRFIVVGFFLKNTKCDDKKLASLVSKVKNTQDKSNYDQAISTIKDLNKYFNKFGIKAALESERITTHLGDNKLEIRRNPMCW